MTRTRAAAVSVLACPAICSSCSPPAERQRAGLTGSESPVQVENVVRVKSLVDASTYDEVCLVDANQDGVPDLVVRSYWRPESTQSLELEKRLVAVDGLTGAALWRTEPGSADAFSRLLCAGPVVLNLERGKDALAFDARSGELLSRAPASDTPFVDASRFAAREVEMTVAGLSVLLRAPRAPSHPRPYCHGQALPMELSPSDNLGKRWSQSLGVYRGILEILRIAHTDDTIVVVGREGDTIEGPDSAIGVDPATSRRFWTRSFARVGFVAARGPRAYLSADSVVRKIDARTGRDEWFARASSP